MGFLQCFWHHSRLETPHIEFCTLWPGRFSVHFNGNEESRKKKEIPVACLILVWVFFEIPLWSVLFNRFQSPVMKCLLSNPKSENIFFLYYKKKKNLPVYSGTVGCMVMVLMQQTANKGVDALGGHPAKQSVGYSIFVFFWNTHCIKKIRKCPTILTSEANNRDFFAQLWKRHSQKMTHRPYMPISDLPSGQWWSK